MVSEGFFGPATVEFCNDSYQWLLRFMSETRNLFRDKRNRTVIIYLPVMVRGILRFQAKYVPGRSLDQMILPAGINNLISQITSVIDNDCFIPQRYGILLEGPPGNGKHTIYYAYCFTNFIISISRG